MLSYISATIIRKWRKKKNERIEAFIYFFFFDKRVGEENGKFEYIERYRFFTPSF